MGSKKVFFFTLYVFIQFVKGEQDGRRDPWCRHDLQLRASASPGARQRREYIFFLWKYNKESKQVGLNALLWGSLLLHTASPMNAQKFGLLPL